MREPINAIPFYPCIERIISDMQFDKDMQLKRCVAAAYLALIQISYDPGAEFYEVDRFQGYPKVSNSVGLRFRGIDGTDFGIRMSNHSNPQYIYDEICKLSGLI